MEQSKLTNITIKAHILSFFAWNRYSPASIVSICFHSLAVSGIIFQLASVNKQLVHDPAYRSNITLWIRLFTLLFVNTCEWIISAKEISEDFVGIAMKSISWCPSASDTKFRWNASLQAIFTKFIIRGFFFYWKKIRLCISWFILNFWASKYLNLIKIPVESFIRLHFTLTHLHEGYVHRTWSVSWCFHKSTISMYFHWLNM